MIYVVWPRNEIAELNRAIGQIPDISLTALAIRHPWQTIAVVVLGLGVAAEALNWRLSPVVNVGSYFAALVSAIWGISIDWHLVPMQQIYWGMIFYAVSVALISLFD